MLEAVYGERDVRKAIDRANDGIPHERSMGCNDWLESKPHRINLLGDPGFQ